jgi:hypothetical protein
MTKTITGHDLKLLGESFNPFEVQLLTGIFKADISRHTSPLHIDKPLTDACCCFVIRTLLSNPELAPLKEFKHHQDLVNKIAKVGHRFPLPKEAADTGIYIGRSKTSSYSLNRGSNEMTAISLWITILMDHIDGIDKEGTNHFLYKLMENEALSRNPLGMNKIISQRGWSKDSPSNHYHDPLNPRITGKEIKVLQKDLKYSFDNIEIQYLLGSFMSYISTVTDKNNINLPLNDATKSMLIRFLLEYPDQAPLPDLVEYDEFKNIMVNADGQLPFPTNISNLAIIMGRASSTVHALSADNISRRHMPVLRIWSTMLCRELGAIKKWQNKHPMMKAIHAEIESRDLNISTLIDHRGWPRKKKE